MAKNISKLLIFRVINFIKEKKTVSFFSDLLKNLKQSYQQKQFFDIFQSKSVMPK